VQTQFSLLPGVREEGERKEEKDKYPCPPIAYRILVAGAGRQPCSFPTVRSKKRRLCDVFPTFGLRLLRIDRRGANRDPVESARRLPQDQLDALLLPTCKPGRASWRILDSSACVRSQRTENIIIQGGWNNNCSSRVSTDPAQTVIDGNASGSVISITSNSTATLEALTITNGQSNKGGGVYVSGASPTLDNVVVSGNAISTMLTSFPQGGGVYVGTGSITLKGCDIAYNTAYQGAAPLAEGGGLGLDGGAHAVLNATRIMSNVNASGSTLYGGGVLLDSGSQVRFEGTENLVAYNEATYGAGVYMWGNVDLEGALIAHNHAANWGGGVFVGAGYSGGRIANNYLVGNNSGTKGSSMLVSHSNMEIANNTIVGDLTGSGAAIDITSSSSGDLKLTNNIVVSHTIGIRKDGSQSVILVTNDVWGNTTNYSGLSAGSTDIHIDPQFVDPASEDYHLTSDSQCIDAGTGVDRLHVDYDGERRPRPWFDIGADEYPKEFFIAASPLVLKSYSP